MAVRGHQLLWAILAFPGGSELTLVVTGGLILPAGCPKVETASSLSEAVLTLSGLLGHLEVYFSLGWAGFKPGPSGTWPCTGCFCNVLSSWQAFEDDPGGAPLHHPLQRGSILLPKP